MALVRGIVNLSTTNWTLICTVPAGSAGAALDFEVANLAGTQVSLSLAARVADNNPANVVNNDIFRGPIKVADGVDYNPHHIAFLANTSIFAKTTGATVNVSYSGEDGV